jgi:hypothetical protein
LNSSDLFTAVVALLVYDDSYLLNFKFSFTGIERLSDDSVNLYENCWFAQLGVFCANLDDAIYKASVTYSRLNLFLNSGPDAACLHTISVLDSHIGDRIIQLVVDSGEYEWFGQSIALFVHPDVGHPFHFDWLVGHDLEIAPLNVVAPVDALSDEGFSESSSSDED